MPEPKPIVIEVVGEGKTDIGPATPKPKVESPTAGVVPVLVHRLCGEPATMQVIRCKPAFLQKGGLERKVKAAKLGATIRGSAGLVYVVDTEGDHPGQINRLKKGRDAAYPDLPTAVGVAHPCIEAWLLSDRKAIARAMSINSLAEAPPEHPEDLPAPRPDWVKSPKGTLAHCAGRVKPLASKETTAIALHLHLESARTGCPKSFAPFAVEIESRIRPIFAG